MPLKNKQTFLYTSMKQGNRNIWRKKQQGKSESNQPGALYHTCSQCPLEIFIRVLVDNNLNALVISGAPRIEDIAEAWACIYAEYIDLNQDNEAIYLMGLQKDIILLKQTILEVENAIYFLSIMYDKRLVQILIDNDFDCVLDPSNQNKYQQTLKIIENRLCSVRLQMDIKQTEYEEYLKGRASETITADYFNKMLVRISKYMGYHVRASMLTVLEFVNMVKDYLDSRKENKPQLENGE